MSRDSCLNLPYIYFIFVKTLKFKVLMWNGTAWWQYDSTLSIRTIALNISKLLAIKNYDNWKDIANFQTIIKFNPSLNVIFSFFFFYFLCLLFLSLHYYISATHHKTFISKFRFPIQFHLIFDGFFNCYKMVCFSLICIMFTYVVALVWLTKWYEYFAFSVFLLPLTCYYGLR